MATNVCDNGSRIVVLQNSMGYSFNISDNYLEWDTIRLIWIAFYKNINNNKNRCSFNQLPKDLIKHIVKFVGVKLNGENKHHCVRLA